MLMGSFLCGIRTSRLTYSLGSIGLIDLLNGFVLTLALIHVPISFFNSFF
jgi:hypothetical protein